MVSVDSRHEPAKRQRAAEQLRMFTSYVCTAVGACADFGVMCNSFLRKYDCADRDIDGPFWKLDSFSEKMRQVFQRG